MSTPASSDDFEDMHAVCPDGYVLGSLVPGIYKTNVSEAVSLVDATSSVVMVSRGPYLLGR